jgi:hypothetical protein
MIKFKKTKISISVLAIVSTISFSSFADNGELKIDFSDKKMAEQVKKSENARNDSVKRKVVNENIPIISNEGYTGELNSYEGDLINKKEHVLLKHLYEQQKLEKLRELLDNYEKGQAYKNAVDEKVPLTPDQITSLRQLLREAEKAKAQPLNGGVTNNIRTIDIDVDAPKPIVLNVASGYASSIVFFDHSGSPWPIDGDIIGNKAAFDSKPGSKESNHSAVFEIKQEFVESNALINLVGLNVPIVVKLNGNDKNVDARLSVRIPKFGPNAQMQTYASGELQSASSESLRVLDGDRLPNSKRYKLNGLDGEVTYANKTLYIRTRASLISPPWKNMVNSTTGYKVYELPPVNNLWFSVDGEMVNATIEKSFEVKLEQRKSIFSDN